MSPAADPLWVVYIAGDGHSGSTLLSMLLGGHSQLVGGGELELFSQASRAGGRPGTERACTCGAGRVGECRFWRGVERRIVEQCGASLDRLDVGSADPATFGDHNLALLRALRDEAGAAAVVDSSKDHPRLRRLLGLPGLRVSPLHLRRSPYGVAHSHRRRGRSLAAPCRTVGARRAPHAGAARRPRALRAALRAPGPRAPRGTLSADALARPGARGRAARLGQRDPA